MRWWFGGGVGIGGGTVPLRGAVWEGGQGVDGGCVGAHGRQCFRSGFEAVGQRAERAVLQPTHRGKDNADCGDDEEGIAGAEQP